MEDVLPNNTLASTDGSSSRWTCVTCRRRKVKCDKRIPCSNCIRANIDCVTPESGRASAKTPRRATGKRAYQERTAALEELVQSIPEARRSMSLDSPIANSPGSDADVFRKWRKVSHLGHRALDPLSETAGHDFASPSIADTYSGQRIQPNIEASLEDLLPEAGGGRYINTCLLDVLQVEVPNPTFKVKGANERPHIDEGVSFHLHSCQPDHLTIRPDLMQVIWDRFKSAIDPILKVLHVPSMEAVIVTVSNVKPVSKEEEALLFAVSYITVRSMTQEDCLAELGESQHVLSAYYRLGYEQASARAGFMEATSLVTMQAHVLYLATLRGEADPRAMWAMMGLAARAAQSFGLHRDGGHWGHLSPFSVEMRRRLWWQLLDLDARISEDNGRSPLIAETRFDTQMPLNVHDTDLDKKMHELPDSRTGVTNVTISLIRFELTNLLRRVLLGLEDEDKQTVKDSGETWVTQGQQWIEKTYLSDLDTSQPFAGIVATYARLVMSKMWLVIYAPSTKRHEATEIDSDISAKLVMPSIEAVEEGNRLHSNPQIGPYAWYFERDVQWHSLIILLSELCRNSSGSLVDRAWGAIEVLVRDRFLSEKGSAQQQVLLWQLVRRLMIKARMTRERKFLEESLRGGEIYGYRLKALDSHPAIDALLASESLV